MNRTRNNCGELLRKGTEAGDNPAGGDGKWSLLSQVAEVADLG
jgi:hypothetical protein